MAMGSVKLIIHRQKFWETHYAPTPVSWKVDFPVLTNRVSSTIL